MADDDLIRRGDALNAIKPIYGWSIAAGEELEAAIAALEPADDSISQLKEKIEALEWFCDIDAEDALAAKKHLEKLTVMMAQNG